jgi:hypothetical protein
VLRPLNKPNDNVIHQIVEFTGRKVGTEYSTAEARRAVIFADRLALEPNLQYCTRLVAQAYEAAGISIVPNADYCTPQQILESAILQRIDGALKIATSQDVTLAKEENTATDLMEDATNALFDAVRHKFGDQIQNFEQLSNFVVDYPAEEPVIFQILLDSGYLKVWEQEEQLNPQQYNYDHFMTYFNEEPAQYWAAGKLMVGADQQIEFYLQQIIIAEMNFQQHPIPYFKSFVELYKNLLHQMLRMKGMAMQVLSKFNT